MARSGINKALVQMAADRLLAKGQRPSIDSVRVELGNTGSKATIHRYLKELDEEDTGRKRSLSDTLSEFVARLAEQMHQEAECLVEQSRKDHSVERETWNERLVELQTLLNASEQKITALSSDQEQLDQQRAQALEEIRHLALNNERLSQKLSGQEHLLQEKNTQIASLEEKHHHARAALEHYRTSIKDQRDQDERRHDQQIQQLQAEIRQLNQTLSIKQSEITSLNKSNGELVSEVKSLRHQYNSADSARALLETRNTEIHREYQAATAHLNELKGAEARDRNEMDLLKTSLQAATERARLLELELARVQSELTVKNLLFDRLNLSNSTTAA